MDYNSNAVNFDNCPQCEGPLENKTSAKSGNSYQQCPKSKGGCGWWSGDKGQQQGAPQKRTFGGNQGGNFQQRPKFQKAPVAVAQGAFTPRANPIPAPVVNPVQQATVVEAKEEVNSLLLELFRERLMKDELVEKVVVELQEQLASVQMQLDLLVARSNPSEETERTGLNVQSPPSKK